MDRSKEAMLRRTTSKAVPSRPIPKLMRKSAIEARTTRSRDSFAPLSKAKSDENLSEPQYVEAGSTPSFEGKNNAAVEKLIMEMTTKTLLGCVWYHGLIPRGECECMLKNDGDFVVRRTTLKKSSTFCLSVMHTTPKHFPIEYKKCSWTLYQTTGGTLSELIDALVKSATVIGSSGAVLKNPIQRPDYYLLHENITTDKKLGAGAFGEVYTGVLKMKGGEEVAVAVKRMKGQDKKTKVVEFVKEAKLMRRFCHPNCVRLWGVATQEEPLMIVLELCPNGSLKSWFKNHLQDANLVKQQLAFIQDAARGMCYLSLSNVIHRDLAARNCLLGKNNELKISDFGLSVADKSVLVLDKLKSVPVKWLAPETLQKGQFTTKTDVWSYGVLVWEIYAKCKTDPFPNMNNTQAKEIILADGHPMTPPPESPPIVQEVFNVCFHKNPDTRANFVQVLKLVAPEEKPPSVTKAAE